MHTQAHAVINFALLRKKTDRDLNLPIVLGAILPDIPIVLFYFYKRIFLGLSERSIWAESYFQQGAWQNVIDLFHSFPVLAICLGVARILKRNRLTAFIASMLLHPVFDFPLHHDDAHRHFYPLSNWRWRSPVSYWDPIHHGAVMILIEFLLVTLVTVWIWRQGITRAGKIGLIIALLLYQVPLAFYSSAGF